MDDTTQLGDDARKAVSDAVTLDELEQLRVAFLGKKGTITEKVKTLGGLPPEQRKSAGAALNALKDEITALIEVRRAVLEKSALDVRLRQEKIDVTVPPRPERRGSIHPISQAVSEALAIFTRMGFAVAEGPDIEDDYHNFSALNFSDDHPARQMHDTFYLPPAPDGTPRLLRTHTSTVQIRAMRNQKPPLRIIAPGTTYRSDSDMTHTPMFHQIEGLVVDKNIHMGHLKGCLISFVKAFFAVDDLPVRFRASFFPFTEPSAEMDIGCARESGKIAIGKGADWLEILGCGMVHPNVLKNCGIDPNEYQGFAFGMGVERLAMLKYAIPDLRTFFEGDLRWLKHYGFSAFGEVA